MIKRTPSKRLQARNERIKLVYDSGCYTYREIGIMYRISAERARQIVKQERAKDEQKRAEIQPQ
jgi:hypothetical protein